MISGVSNYRTLWFCINYKCVMFKFVFFPKEFRLIFTLIIKFKKYFVESFANRNFFSVDSFAKQGTSNKSLDHDDTRRDDTTPVETLEPGKKTSDEECRRMGRLSLFRSLVYHKCHLGQPILKCSFSMGPSTRTFNANLTPFRLPICLSL